MATPDFPLPAPHLPKNSFSLNSIRVPRLLSFRFFYSICVPRFVTFFSFEYMFSFHQGSAVFMTFPPSSRGWNRERWKKFLVASFGPRHPIQFVVGKEVLVSRVPFGTSEIFSPTAPEESNFMFPKKKSIFS
jgi:hypothetical protein